MLNILLLLILGISLIDLNGLHHLVLAGVFNPFISLFTTAVIMLQQQQEGNQSS